MGYMRKTSNWSTRETMLKRVVGGVVAVVGGVLAAVVARRLLHHRLQLHQHALRPKSWTRTANVWPNHGRIIKAVRRRKDKALALVVPIRIRGLDSTALLHVLERRVRHFPARTRGPASLCQAATG